MIQHETNAFDGIVDEAWKGLLSNVGLTMELMFGTACSRPIRQSAKLAQSSGRVRKRTPPISLWRVFLMIMAVEFSAAIHMANFGNAFVPEIVALLVPGRAGEMSLYVIAAFALSGVTSIYWGHLADKWKDFRGLLIGLNVLVLVCSCSTWFIFRYRGMFGVLTLPIFAIISTAMGAACIGGINMTFNLVAVYALAYPQYGTTLMSLVRHPPRGPK